VYSEESEWYNVLLMRYTSVALGGTFDRLHKGHKALLSTAFTLGDHVTIGLTTDAYIQRNKPYCASLTTPAITSFMDRKNALEMWVGKEHLLGRCSIVPLDDSYGPTVLDGTHFDAIIVSDETKHVAERINTIRNEKRLSELAIAVVPMVPAEDFERISSTRIRSGTIDRDGRLVLPSTLRTILKKSIGVLIPDAAFAEILAADSHRTVIAVGDMTTKRLLENGVVPTVAAIDFQIERQPFDWDKTLFDRLTKNAYVLEMKSGPGYISREVIQEIVDWFRKPGTLSRVVFIIDGEEDLLVLPILREAPLGSVLYYGQPKEGIVRVEVTEEKKHQVASMLHAFVHQA